MKNHKNIYLALFLCITAFCASCRKYINETPINAPTTANFWVSEQAAQNGLAGAYTLLRTALLNRSSYFTFGDATAGEFASFNGDIAYTDFNTNGQYNFNYTPYGQQWNDWTTFYQLIAQCNLIINKVPGIPASAFTDDPTTTKKQIIGEAYFLRAFAYYYITEVWGAPVIVTQVYTNPITAQPIARSTDAQGYAQAASDAKQSAGMLQYGYSNPTNVAVQANKGAALTLLSKVYMWQKQYQQAAATADSVIKYGRYNLEPGATYKNIFKGHDQESIFELYMLYSGADNEATGDAFNMFLQTPYIVNQQGAWYVDPVMISNLYGDTSSTSADIRVKNNFYGLQSTNPLMVKYADVVYQNSGTQTTAYVSDDLVIFRLADVFLTRAEAAAQLGDLATGDMYLSLVRLRAGLSPYTATSATDLIYNVMDERGREFFGEGSWYFDLYRTGLIADPNYENAVPGYNQERVNGGGCEWPIGLRALLQQDPLLVQNKWWASH